MRRTTAAAGVLLATLATAACQPEDDPAGLRVVEDQRPTSVEGETVWLQIPTGRVAATFGEPVTSIEDVDGRVVEASAGELFVPFVVEDQPREGVPAAVVRLLDGSDVTPSVSIAAGGGSWSLGAGSAASVATTLPLQPQWLAVPEGAADTLALEVAFGGVTQQVGADGERGSGAAAALYEPVPVDGQACDDGWRVRGAPRAQLSVTCSAVAFAYPYAPDRGWAADDGEGTWGFFLLDTQVLRLALGPGATDEECRPLRTRDVELGVDGSAGEPGFDVDVLGGHGLGLTLPDPGTDAARSWPAITADISVGCQGASGEEPPLAVTRSFTLDPA